MLSMAIRKASEAIGMTVAAKKLVRKSPRKPISNSKSNLQIQSLFFKFWFQRLFGTFGVFIKIGFLGPFQKYFVFARIFKSV